VLRNTLGPTTNPNRDLRFTAPTQRSLPEPLTSEELQALRERTAPPNNVR
jgi:hypothetical protein